MKAVNEILRYLKTTPSKGLLFREIDRKAIEAYIDSTVQGLLTTNPPLVTVPLYGAIL